MKLVCTITCVFISLFMYAQKDSLKIGDPYFEDQLYISTSYSTLFNQPEGFNSSAFSYSISTGYIKDIPFNSARNIALGLGVGYGFDSFNHDFSIGEANGELVFDTQASSESTNKLRLHNLEFPIEFRWRTSTANKYSFWRVYAGAKITYNFNNIFKYSSGTISYTDVEQYNRWQTGLTLSVGYDVFNLNFYYGLSPILKDVPNVDTKILKIGLIFYLL